MSSMMDRVEDFLKNHLEDLTRMILNVCVLPSPTGSEGEKAAFVLRELERLGARGAYMDGAGNVLYPYGTDQYEKASLYCAHMDTVFEGTGKITPRIADNRIYAPSAWDNSSGVAGLLLIIRMLLELNIPLPKGILFAFSVGEEGLGSLKGIRQIFTDWGNRILDVVAVDGSCGSFMNAGVGSRRYQVNVETAGGHSWKDFGGENAIAAAAGIIRDIYGLEVPAQPRTTYNVGVIRGGTTVNAIAAHAEFLLDLRSEAESALSGLDLAVHALVSQANKDGVKAEMAELGVRPCGSLGHRTELENRIMRIRAQAGLPTRFHASSTDANLPLSLGIPALTFGIGEGDHTHTVNEYLELSSLEGGILQLARFLLAPACDN